MSSSLTGKRCENIDLVLEALGQVLECSVQSLCDFIEKGESGLSQSESAMRTWCAAMLNKMPNTCLSLRDRMRVDARYTCVMFYERTRLGAASSGHFLEGLAAGLSLFSGHTAVQLHNDDLSKLRLRDVVADRIKTVANLEGLKNDTKNLKKLVDNYTLQDIPEGLPGRVHVFISRMRAICQGLRRVKAESHFQQCKNRECNRWFYMGGPTEAPVNNGNGSVDPVDAYWDNAAGSPEIKHEQREFCTWSCCEQWKWQLDNAMPRMTPDFMIADYQCRKQGRARVSEAMRACTKRNEVAGRHFRNIQKEQRTFPAISRVDLNKAKERRVAIMNVDLGLLYAAAVCAESKSLCVNKVLPGASEGWRSRPMFYCKSQKSVRAIYNKHHVGGNVIANMHVREPFLVKLKEKAGRLF